MDDVNNMDESMDRVEESPGGISRRDMIKASVIAGGLVWSAPVLLTGKAVAQVHPCCPTGFDTAVAFKITGLNNQTGLGVVNCGSSCLDARAGTNLPCSTGLPDCLINEGFVDVMSFDSGSGPGNGMAQITVNTNATVISVAANTAQLCFFADCDTTPTPFANSCVASGGGTCPTPPTPDRISVNVTPGGTIINVNLQASDGNLQHVELFLCVNSFITGICP